MSEEALKQLVERNLLRDNQALATANLTALVTATA
jgi:hypothetical protein